MSYKRVKNDCFNGSESNSQLHSGPKGRINYLRNGEFDITNEVGEIQRVSGNLTSTVVDL
jgi:hypothetical protein